MSVPSTGSQTVGPYYSIGLDPQCAHSIPMPDNGDKLLIRGSLLDGRGVGIPDGFLELWQADTEGHYISRAAESVAEAQGFARIKTGPAGEFEFTTTKPGSVPYDGSRMQAPHLVVLVYMRGLLRNLVTRLYFPDDPLNATDPVLQLVPENRRSTLIATRDDGPMTLRWDIVMRQEKPADRDETVFFVW
jgi:protocatechuate 3,4-dioxygenase alpha subunit